MMMQLCLKHELLKNPNIVDVSAKNGGQWMTRCKNSQ